MAGFFEFSSTRPRTISNVLLGVSAGFLLLGTPLTVYGLSLPSTLENEMLPFILLLCGLMLNGFGLAMLVVGWRIRRQYPAD